MYSPNAFPGDLSELTMIQFPLLSLYKKYLACVYSVQFTFNNTHYET